MKGQVIQIQLKLSRISLILTNRQKNYWNPTNSRKYSLLGIQSERIQSRDLVFQTFSTFIFQIETDISPSDEEIKSNKWFNQVLLDVSSSLYCQSEFLHSSKASCELLENWWLESRIISVLLGLVKILILTSSNLNNKQIQIQ